MFPDRPFQVAFIELSLSARFELSESLLKLALIQFVLYTEDPEGIQLVRWLERRVLIT